MYNHKNPYRIAVRVLYNEIAIILVAYASKGTTET